MTSKNALLHGAALAAVIAFGAAAADAKPVHHKKPVHAAKKAEAVAMPSEVSELRSEVQSLRATLEAQAQAQAALQAQLAQQQSQVAQVVSDNASVEARLETVPQQVLTAVGELPKPKPSWADKTQVSGRVYFDFTNIEQKSNGQSVAPSGTAFDIKRAYIGVDHQFNDVYSANITTDFQYSSAVGATELYIKKAYLQAKYFPWLTLRAGASDLPWIPFVEDLYGYRHIENVLIDRAKFGTSTDWGLHALGTFDPIGDKSTGPVVSYAVSVIDGTGYKVVPGTGSAPRTDTLDVEGRVSVKWMDFTAAIGGYEGRLGKDAGATYNAPIAANVVRHDASRFDALIAYVHGPFRIGGEYFSANNWTAVANVAKDKAEGYSGFGSYQFDPQWSVFGRYDYVQPNKDTAAPRKSDYFNVGIDYRPVAIVDLALVYKRDKVTDGTFSTSNGVIGGSNNGTYDEFGLWGQFRW